MNKLKPEDLDKIRQRMDKIIRLRKGLGKAKITVHMGTCGIEAGARTIMSTLLEEIERRDLDGILLMISDCAGSCSHEPMMTVEIENEPPVKYIDLTREKTLEILEKHILGGTIVKEYALSIEGEKV